MDPITLAAGASAVSGILGFKGNRAAARAAQQTAEYNAQVAENEAVLAARAKVQEEVNLRKQSDRLVGLQRTSISKSGVQITGSPYLALADAYFATEQDALAIQFASNVEQTRAEADAALARAAGRASSTAYNTRAYTTLLDAAGKTQQLLA